MTTVADTLGGEPAAAPHGERRLRLPWLPGGGVHLDGSVAFTSSANATKLSQTAQASDEATLEVWLDAGKASPVRPGRIAGIMKDSARSIALSQGFFEGQPTTTYDARVRTTGSYGNPLATPAPSATTGVQHLVLRRAADGRTTVVARRPPGRGRGHRRRAELDPGAAVPGGRRRHHQPLRRRRRPRRPLRPCADRRRRDPEEPRRRPDAVEPRRTARREAGRVGRTRRHGALRRHRQRHRHGIGRPAPCRHPHHHVGRTVRHVLRRSRQAQHQRARPRTGHLPAVADGERR